MQLICAINIVDALLVAQLYVNLISELACPDDTPTPTPEPQTDPVWSGGPYTLNGTTDYVDLPDGFTTTCIIFPSACRVNINFLDTRPGVYDLGGDTDIFMMLTPASGNTGYPYFCSTLSGNDGEQGLDRNRTMSTNPWQHIADASKNKILEFL